ncbi:MAG: diacylglycerol kinase family protein [Myxococcota bacterium]|nr:diacylglycerol kinase family protein [Myxococcota bacterium]
MSLSGRLQSFGYAIRGVGVMLRTQHNAWLHAIVSALVLFAGFALEVSNAEWQIIVLAFVAVWAAEAMNTALEFLCDVASAEHHPLIEKAKDVAAGGVLLSALGAAVIGLLIFVPRVLALVGYD